MSIVVEDCLLIVDRAVTFPRGSKVPNVTFTRTVVEGGVAFEERDAGSATIIVGDFGRNRRGW